VFKYRRLFDGSLTCVYACVCVCVSVCTPVAGMLGEMGLGG
jgi:hypothetical protein